MAQLMKQTIVFGAGLAGLAALTQTASADTEAKPLTLEEVKAENAKRLATYETEKREIDERNRVKRAQYRDAYTQYAELADRGGVEPQEPEYEPLPTLELLEEPIELPFDVNDVTPVETVANGDTVNDAKEVVATPEVKETGAKEETTEVVTPEVKETGAKEETTEAVTSEVKETGAKEETTSEVKETGEKTSSDAVAAQLEGEKTSSEAVAAQLNKTLEETTTTSSADAAAQVSKIEAEKSTETTTQSETPTETTSSADAAAQVAKLEAEKSANSNATSSETTTKSEEAETTTSAPATTDTSEKSNENGGVQARGAVTTTEETTNKEKSADSLPHTGDASSLMSIVGVALSGLGGVGLRRKRK